MKGYELIGALEKEAQTFLTPERAALVLQAAQEIRKLILDNRDLMDGLEDGLRAMRALGWEQEEPHKGNRRCYDRAKAALDRSRGT